MFAVILVDQLSKQVVLALAPQMSFKYVHFILHFNKGAMLGLFSDLPPVLRIVSLSTGGAFLLFSFVIFQYLFPTRSLMVRVGMSILMGGILGNVIDRLIWGHVIDFIVLGTKAFSTGVFNLADLLQWIGYFIMGYALMKDQDQLWPKDNLRKEDWLNPRFQLRYCYTLVTCGLGFAFIAGVFSYTFLKFVVIDLIGDNQKFLDQFLIPFLLTFCSFSIAFGIFLFMIGKKLSHRIVGPMYAFERFLNNYIEGDYRQLKLRRGDELGELEQLAEKIAQRLRPLKPDENEKETKSEVTPLLPRGQDSAPSTQKIA